MITSKLTRKAQTIVPQAIRLALGVGAGDEIAYSFVNGSVMLTNARTPSFRRGMPFATFCEWDTPEDEEAYKDL